MSNYILEPTPDVIKQVHENSLRLRIDRELRGLSLWDLDQISKLIVKYKKECNLKTT